VSQQINLYNPALYPKKELLTAGFMATMGVLLFVLLGAYAAHLKQQAARLMQQRDALISQTKQEQEKTVRLAKQFPARQPSPTLQGEIAAAEAEMRDREQVFEVLKGGGFGGSTGFSGLMQAFARQNVDGLWLVSFSANGAGDQMRINGRALAPDMIPEYLGRLSAEQSLRGRVFTGLTVSQPRPVVPQGQSTSAPLKTPSQTLPQYVEFSLSAEKRTEKPVENSGTAKTVETPMAGAKS